MRCASEVSRPSATAAGLPGVGGVCGELEVDQGDLSAFCSSLELLDSPYTCEEVRSVSWSVAKVGCVQQQECYAPSNVNLTHIASVFVGDSP